MGGSSILCMYCLGDQAAVEQAECRERAWNAEEYPSQFHTKYDCPMCGQHRHWWFFMWVTENLSTGFIGSGYAPPGLPKVSH
jgi:hypothetical protein